MSNGSFFNGQWGNSSAGHFRAASGFLCSGVNGPTILSIPAISCTVIIGLDSVLADQVFFCAGNRFIELRLSLFESELVEQVLNLLFLRGKLALSDLIAAIANALQTAYDSREAHFFILGMPTLEP